MQKIGFSEALDNILGKHPEYDREAYLFLRDALEFTVSRQKKQKGEGSRHVDAAQLLEGIRDHALAEFGPMVPTVLQAWGVTCSRDFGIIVFNLIEAGIFGRTPNDQLEDFAGGFDFHEAFVRPFLPSPAAQANEKPLQSKLK